MRRKWPLAVGAVVLILIVVVGLFRLARRPPHTEAEARQRLLALSPSPRDLNLVVITLDTTRADRLGCYGFAGIETPNIDALAAEGVLFEHAMGTVQKPGDEVMDGALAWLEKVGSRKFFAWVHLYDPHTPYDPPVPLAGRY